MAGVAGDNNTIRIGTEATQTRAFMAGINGNAVANQNTLVIDSVTGQLGATTDSGPYTPTTLVDWNGIPPVNVQTYSCVFSLI
jgi:hypothetical protein